MRISDWSSDVCSSDLGAVAADDAARTVPGAAADGAAPVHAVHRLGDEVLGEVAGIGERPAVAAGTVVALADGITPRRGVPIVVVLGGVGLGLVRETGRAHVCTPVTTEHIVCSLLLEQTH